MKTILVAVDIRQDAAQVLGRAAQLARQHQSVVTILHVAEEAEQAPGRSKTNAQPAQAVLSTLISAARFDRPPSLRIERGTPHQQIAQIAEAQQPDLILIGPGRPAGLKERVLGSTIDHMLRVAMVPVLVVRDALSTPYRRIAVGVDFSPACEAAIATAHRLAPDARMTLVHAREIATPFEQAMLRAGTSADDADRYRQARWHEWREDLHILAQRHAPRARASVLRGEPAEMLARLAASGRIGLIAFGSKQRSAVAHAVLGSAIERVLSVPGCDVLLAPVQSQSAT